MRCVLITSFKRALCVEMICILMSSLSLQVVAGIKYYIKVKMGKTICRKVNADKGCPVHTDPAMAKVITLFN